MTLAEALERVPGGVAAAWVDTRTGELVERQSLIETPHVTFAMEAISSVLCAPDRPRRSVLLSRTHVFIAQQTEDPGTALLVACTRSINLGFSIAAVRSLVEEAP